MEKSASMQNLSRLASQPDPAELLEYLAANPETILKLCDALDVMGEALGGVIDPNPCATDHNLFCQEHGSSYPCVQQIARDALNRAKEILK